MRIGLDLRPTEVGFKAHAGRGTGRYTGELVDAMEALASEGSELSLVPIHSKELQKSSLDRCLVNYLPFGARTIESQYLFPRRLSSLDVDVIHFFAHGDAPARAVMPQIVSVLDLIPLKFPELYKADKPNARFKFARWLEYEAIRSSIGVVAISESTKADVVDLLKIPEERVMVTPLAVAPRLLEQVSEYQQANISQKQQRQRLGLPEDEELLLYVGGIDPRKNVPFLCDVLAELLKTRAPDAKKLRLLLAGGIEKDDQYPLLLSRISSLGISDSVTLLGFVPDEDLVSLYQAADLFLFPSLYEGFGFPVLEAMACGTPVIAGNNSSIPEVAGTSGILLPDKDKAAWVSAISALLGRPESLYKLSLAGVAQARHFSWKRTAERTFEAYQRFAASDSGSSSHFPIRAVLNSRPNSRKRAVS